MKNLVHYRPTDGLYSVNGEFFCIEELTNIFTFEYLKDCIIASKASSEVTARAYKRLCFVYGKQLPN